MKLLVCVSKTPDTTAKISFKDNNTVFNEDGVQYIMNPYDEWYALVRGIELKEQLGAGSVTVLNVGPASNDQIIRKALAIGADEAVRIDGEPKDSFYVATQIANYAKDNGMDMVLLGKETIDHNGSEVGSMVAGLLDQPYISYATNMEVSGTTATIVRDVEGGKETVELDTPFVLSAAKGLAEQRIPNMRGIMMAKRKPLNVVPATDVAPQVEVSAFELPPVKSECKYVDPENMDELVALLHNEAKVI